MAEITSLTEQRDVAFEQRGSAEEQKSRAMNDIEQRYQAMLETTEQEYEEKLRTALIERSDQTLKTEENLNQMKSFYEMDKEAAVQRVTEEKEKVQKQAQLAIEELEQKIREDQERYSDEMELIQAQFQDLEQTKS